MAKQQIDGVSLAAILAGSIFAWAGIKGYSIGTSVQNVIAGKPPAGSVDYPITGTDATVLTSTGPGSANPKSGTWTHAGLMKLWVQAGGSQGSAQNAACHAIQESSGNASVTSSNPDGGTNVGLWQLDTKGKGAGYSVAQLQNPALNARITVQATNDGRDWSAWATPGC